MIIFLIVVRQILVFLKIPRVKENQFSLWCKPWMAASVSLSRYNDTKLQEDKLNISLQTD